jgi:hypothetical protein
MKLAEQILEYVGDGKFEKVTADNFGHLEIGDYIMAYRGEPNLKVEFLGWVVPDTDGKQKAKDDEVNPEKVNLLFKEKNGSEFECYHYKGNYCAGSSADPIKVKAV